VRNKAGIDKEKGPRRFTPQALLDPPVKWYRLLFPGVAVNRSWGNFLARLKKTTISILIPTARVSGKGHEKNE
jgi:hypothetical protein